MKTHHRAVRWGAVAAIAALIMSGCSLGSTNPGEGESAKPGSLATAADLSKLQISVGGKEFTEQLILCELAAQSLEAAGAKVDRSCGMSGSNTVRAALKSGDIQLYWEYTGTGWVTHLKQTEIVKDPEQLFNKVNQMDTKDNKIAWISRAPANNTYAIAVKTETSDSLKIKTISEYAKLANDDPKKATFCGASEFFGRDDGWAGLQKAYDFKLPEAQRSELALGAIYASVGKGDPCTFGEVFATDGRVKSLNLTVLKDDKSFFPVYNPAISVAEKTLADNPGIEKVLSPVAAKLDDATLQTLNAKVDVDGEEPAAVVKAWLKEQGFTG